MGDQQKALKNLEVRLLALSDLPETHKTLDQRIAELDAELVKLEVLSARLGLQKEIDNFDRTRFLMAKDRLLRELSRLKQEVSR